MLTAMVLVFAGCGNRTEAPSAETPLAENTSESQQETNPPSDSAVHKDVTDEGEFKGHMHSNGEDFYLTGYTGDADIVVVPDKIDGHTVTVIDFGAFLGKDITSITLPDSVREIGDSAFQECKKLKEIHFGSGLKTVRSLAFALCDSLETLVFPDGMKSLDTTVIAYDPALREVHVPASVEECDQFLDYATCPNVTVYAPAGSAAEKAANAANIPVTNE